MKKIYIIAAAIVTVASAGVTGAIAIGGGRPLSEMKGNVHQLIWSPEVASRAAEREKKGADQTATSTDLTSIVKTTGKKDTKDRPLKDTSSAQEGKIDEHLTINNTYRDLNVCGETFRGKQIVIDGVDVLQRIAQLGRDEKEPRKDIGTKICDGIKPGQYENNEDIKVSEVQKFVSTDQEKLPGETYAVNVSDWGWRFLINIKTGDIYTSSGYDGSLLGPLGKLK